MSVRARCAFVNRTYAMVGGGGADGLRDWNSGWLHHVGKWAMLALYEQLLELNTTQGYEPNRPS